jgi:hypothetical protein
MKWLSIIPALALLTACGKPQVVPMDGDTYLVQERSAQLGIGPPVGAKAEVYQVANEFCALRGRVVETVNFTMVDTFLARPGSVALQFRCVPKSDSNTPRSEPIAQKTALQPLVEKSETERKLDELMKLREKGLISQDEFEKKKKDILDKL